MTIRDEITDDEIHELINLRKFISEMFGVIYASKKFTDSNDGQ